MADADEDAELLGTPLPRPPVKKVHHLSCGTMCMLGRGFVNEHQKLVCHVLLIETEQGLVLVDTGVGTGMLAHPPSKLWTATFRPVLDAEECAATQIKKLGFSVDDVRHIIVTHLDFDHAGGLPDFPKATVHVAADERAAASAKATLLERLRYTDALWSHDVKWQLHEQKGERWYGFPCVRDIPGLPPEILVVPLHGHTRGHCGVAVDAGGHWLHHCGDAYFHKDEMDPQDPWCSPVLAAYQRFIAVDDAVRRKNSARLRELARGVGEGISVFCAHDPDDLARLRGG